MLRKAIRNSFLFVGALLLLVSVTVNAPAQNRDKFGGEWNIVTDRGEKFVLMLYFRTPDFVAGSFSSNGVITGTVKDNVLPFTWKIAGRSGAGRLTFAFDGLSFQATLGATDNPDDASGGTWNGTRPPSFAGAWRGKFGEGALESILQQTGNQVTGQFKVNSAELGSIREGVFAGNTVRFKVVRAGRILGNGARSPDEYVGSGELVLDSGGRSFSGTILGATASGTFITR